VLAEALLNHLDHGQGKFRGFSAGSEPRGTVNPLAIETLQNAGISTADLSSKSWDVFATPDAPTMDLVITVCDNAAGETCPYWPGQPATAHWGYEDPSAISGDDDAKRIAFKATLHAIRKRLELFISLPPAQLERLSLQQTARNIPKTEQQ
jgi:arsenate reductase (thioredoxin)